MEAGYKSPRVPDLSFPSSYRNSFFLSIFAVPNNAVFWITSNLAFTPIHFMYSLKLTDTAVRAPITTGTTMTFRMRQTFAIPSLSSWYFFNFSSSLSFTLSSPGMATSIMTTSLSFLSIKTMSGLHASIFRSHWTVKSHSILKFSLSTTPSGFCSHQLLALSNPHLPQSCRWIYRATLSCLPLYSVCASLPHSLTTGPPFLPYFRTFCTEEILVCDQYEISYNLLSKLVPGRYISGPQYILSNLLLQSTAKFYPSQYLPFLSHTAHRFFSASIHSPSPLLHSLCTPSGPQPLRC